MENSKAHLVAMQHCIAPPFKVQHSAVWFYCISFYFELNYRILGQIVVCGSSVHLVFWPLGRRWKCRRSESVETLKRQFWSW